MTFRSLCIESLDQKPRLIEKTPKPLNKGWVRLKMLYAPINPADINMMHNQYVIQPQPPFVLGNEGVGFVDALGESVAKDWLGKRVIFPGQSRDQWFGFWSEYVDVPVEGCIQIPEFISNEQASMMSINPLTALVILDTYANLKEGDWIIQNAANSALGHWFVYLAKQRGLHSVNIVRRDIAQESLLQLGATHVVVDADGKLKPKQLPQSGNFKLALNGVGWLASKVLASCLDYNGTMVTYGAMAKEPVYVGNVALIYKTIQVLGFNRTLWAETVSMNTISAYYDCLFGYLQQFPCEIPIAHCFDLNAYESAIAKAQESKLNGKILLRLS